MLVGGAWEVGLPVVGDAGCRDEAEEEDREDDDDRARLEGAVMPAGVGAD